MTSEWVRVSLADVTEILSGGTPKTSIPSYWGGNIPWLSVADFNNGYRWVSNAEKHITEKGLSESATTLLQKGDIIISARGTIGALAQLEIPMAFNQSCYGIRGRRGISGTDFLYYLLQETVADLNQVAHGGVFNTITRETFKLIRFYLPPLPEQRAIAHILGTLDDKIELNRQMNKTLESIAQALFKSWFVDFDPVRAKIEGREPEGMDAETAALFPDGFEESELGLVPRGWRVGILADLATLNPESWTVKTAPKFIKYIDLANAKVNEINEITEYSFNEAPSRARRVLRNGDSIIGTVRPGNRSFAYIYQAPDNLTGSTGFAVLRPKISSNAEFLFIAATQDSSIEYLAHVADGGAYPAIRAEVVTNIKTVLPSEIVMGKFHEAVSPIFAKMGENKIQVQTLTTLRDILLPRLISGQLRLREIESQFNNEVFT